MSDPQKSFGNDDKKSPKGKPPTEPTGKLSPDSKKGSDGMKPQLQRNNNDKSDTSI